jgi:hypothetical protein
MTARLLFPAMILLAFPPTVVMGQNVSVDQNAFQIYVNGDLIGREDFSIRQIGPRGQQRITLRGAVEMEEAGGPLHLAPAMEADGETLGVSSYQIKVSGTETTDIFVRVAENRYLARIVSSSGEQLREFRAGPGSVLLDEGVVHHHYLLGSFLEVESTVSLTVLIPRAGRQQRMTLSLIGEEEIRVGGILVPNARRYHLEGGDESRDIWFDDQGRILRLEIPSRSFIAERESVT